MTPDQVPPPICKGDGITDLIQAHLFGGRSARDTAIAEMVRGLGGSHASSAVEDIRVGRDRPCKINSKSILGRSKMSFETWDSPIAKGLMQIMNPGFKKEKVQVIEEFQE